MGVVYFSIVDVKEMYSFFFVVVGLLRRATQYHCSCFFHFGGSSQFISNVVTDSASGEVDIFH